MPITWAVSLLGSLALIGAPFFSGFYSKDMIIEATHASNLIAAPTVYVMLLIGVFVTAFYSFRMFFLVFHGKPRWGGDDHGHAKSAASAKHADHDNHGHDDHGHEGHHGEPHESPAVVTWPLIALAIPSVVLGAWAIGPMLFGDYFAGVIFVDPSHPAMAEIASHFTDWLGMAGHAIVTWPFWLALAGVVTAWYFYLVKPAIPAAIAKQFKSVHTLLDQKYYLDRFNEVVFAGGSRALGGQLWKRADQGLIDGFIVNGSARLVGAIASLMRLGQTGFLYHYAIAMIFGVALMLWWFVPLMSTVPVPPGNPTVEAPAQ